MQQQRQVAIAVTQSKQQNYKWLAALAMLLLMCMTCKLAMANDINLFAEHYQQQGRSALTSQNANPDTKIYVSKDKAADNVSMLEKGYDMVGSSSFISTDVAPDFALKHGQAIKADIVLVYTQYASKRQKAARVAFLKKQAEKTGKVIDETALEAEEMYDYFATYWVKMPMPKLGIHTVKLKQLLKLEDEVLDKHVVAGLRVLAVVNGSAADKAGLLRGDQLMRIGDVEINQAKDLFTAVQQYKGQSVPMRVMREKVDLDLTVELAP